jgi:capsid protein
MLDWIKKKLGLSPVIRDRIVGRYDLAQTTDGNRKHWVAADALSAESANSLGVRRTLRNRVRYEVANNSYVKGIVGTIAYDTIGFGPRLQMLTRSQRNNSITEEDFSAWSKEIKLGKKMRQMRRARLETGEAFVVVFLNPKLKSLVKLDLMVIEADRVTDVGFEYNTDPLWCDGIRYDEYQNPVSYRILRYHPGGPHGWMLGPNGYDDYPAEFIYHYFKEDERPGQRRGVPELTPSIQTGAELRRYDNAVLRTAEVHARMALSLQTDTIPELDDNAADPELPENMDTVEIPESGAIVLPPGMKLSGVPPMQPTDLHRDFVDIKIRETARCVNMPFTIAAMDSSKSNMSARYLDSQIYAAGIRVERADLANEFLEWLFLGHWVKEYWLVRGNVPRGEEGYPHLWYFPSLNQHADPSKVANAQQTRIDSGTTSIADEIAENGDDWEETWIKEARTLGITFEQYQALQRLKRFGTADPDGKPMTSPIDRETSSSPRSPRFAESPNGNGEDEDEK